MDILDFINRDKDRKLKVAVVGDLMLDEYYYVEANRVSPEFPIAVLKSDNCIPKNIVPGGAANVSMQFSDFNVEVKNFGFIDNESKAIFKNFNINVENCITLPRDCFIPRKRRFYNDNFPLCRWDIETKFNGLSIKELHDYQEELNDSFVSQKNDFDVVIFSDYDKGVFSEYGMGARIWSSPAINCIKIVDPKNGPLRRWYGCDVFKPNLKEAKELSGLDSDWRQISQYIAQELSCPHVAITMSGKGVGCYLNSKEHYLYSPNDNINAESVIGAGDCFVSFLSMIFARNFSFKDSVKLAFEASSIYVNRKYNKYVTKQELLNKYDKYLAKQYIPENIVGTKVFTNGCFDFGLTAGHIECLKFAKSQGDNLIVAINSDESIKRLKGKNRPVISLEERIKIISSLDFVDYVISFEEDTPINLIKSLNPDIIVKGGDYNPENVVGYGLAEIKICPTYNCLSTSQKIEMAKNE